MKRGIESISGGAVNPISKRSSGDEGDDVSCMALNGYFLLAVYLADGTLVVESRKFCDLKFCSCNKEPQFNFGIDAKQARIDGGKEGVGFNA